MVERNRKQWGELAKDQKDLLKSSYQGPLDDLREMSIMAVESYQNCE